MSDRRITTPWTEEDVKFLAEHWATSASILVLSIHMGRTASSIQTHASRRNLPKRNEFLDIDRRRWEPEDDELLATTLERMRLADNRIPIVDVAASVGRTIDAVAMRLDLLKIHPDDLRKLVFVPDSLTNEYLQARREEAVDEDDDLGFDDSFEYEDLLPKPKPAMRTCLTCRKSFYSEGVGNRRCDPCKKRE